jgi:hypothetical protein
VCIVLLLEVLTRSFFKNDDFRFNLWLDSSTYAHIRSNPFLKDFPCSSVLGQPAIFIDDLLLEMDFLDEVWPRVVFFL